MLFNSLPCFCSFIFCFNVKHQLRCKVGRHHVTAALRGRWRRMFFFFYLYYKSDRASESMTSSSDVTIKDVLKLSLKLLPIVLYSTVCVVLFSALLFIHVTPGPGPGSGPGLLRTSRGFTSVTLYFFHGDWDFVLLRHCPQIFRSSGPQVFLYSDPQVFRFSDLLSFWSSGL